MTSTRKRFGLGAGVLLVLGLLTTMALVAIAPAGASSVTPTIVADNPSCDDLGYEFGYKPQPEPPPSGTYTFPDGINTVTISSDGTYFDWTSTLGIDAVIVKGGANANVYSYATEALGDTGLHSPQNSSGGFAAISHIEFCYDYEVDVSKDANTNFTRTHEWDIDKTVTPNTWELLTGDSGTSKYTVSVEKTGFTDSEWAVNGTVTVENNTPFDATITGVSDAISDVGAVAVDCGVTFPYTLPDGDSLDCTYEQDLPDASTRTNTATVTTTGIVGGGEATANVIFGDPTTVVNDSINVDDSNGGSWIFSGSGSAMYERTFTCDGGAGKHDNTAMIRETGQSASATVTVSCHALTVTKDAATTFDRDWDWTIDKSADQTHLTLSPGQQFLVSYRVDVDATSTDANWAVSGDITIFNPHPTRAAVLTGVSDVVSPALNASVDCGGATSVPAASALTCSYYTGLPDGASRVNTATATLQNYSFAFDGTPTADGTTDFSGSADVVFGATPTEETDECIAVNDTNLGALGTACASTSPTTFFYTLNLGPYDACGTYTVENVASFVSNDNGDTGSDTWTIEIVVPCEGCTLTQGYWKTHTEYGPAPYDDTWALLPEEADTPFFLSGQSYHEVLWTSPNGNAYYVLAHQYIAAELNFLNGADPSAAQTAFDDATVLLQTYTPDQVAALKGQAKNGWTDLATVLDDYNNGYIGPGHCSE